MRMSLTSSPALLLGGGRPGEIRPAWDLTRAPRPPAAIEPARTHTSGTLRRRTCETLFARWRLRASPRALPFRGGADDTAGGGLDL
jgi:hypothetical protein